MTEERWGASCAVLNNRLFVLGGFTSPGGTLYSCEAYNFTTHNWTKMFDMSVPRSEFSCCIFEGKILACEGLVGDRATDSVEEIYGEEAVNSRRFLSKMNARRIGHKVVVVKGFSWDKKWP